MVMPYLDRTKSRRFADGGVALSMEPQGGSPTGKPTTGFLYQGQCVKVI